MNTNSLFFPSLKRVFQSVMLALIVAAPASLWAQTVTLIPSEINFSWSEARGYNVVDDPNWTVSERNSGSSVPYAVDLQNLQGADWLRIRRPGSPSGENNGAQMMYNTTMGDVAGSVVIGYGGSWDSLSAAGVVLRARTQVYGPSTAGGTHGQKYFLALDSTGIKLFWDARAGFTSNYTVLATGALPAEYSMKRLDTQAGQYRLEFSFIGRELEASLWELEAGVEGADLLITTLTYTDNREEYREEGFLGIRGGDFSGSRSSYFRDFEVSVIPEPGTVAAGLLLGVLLMVAIRRRCR